VLLGSFLGFGFEDKVTGIDRIKTEGPGAFAFECQISEILPGFLA
jgi:hypothetical protein